MEELYASVPQRRPLSGTPARWPLTSGSEAVAYFAAHALRVAATYAVGSAGLLNPLFRWAVAADGRGAVLPLSYAISVVWMLLALLVFLVLRGEVGATPALVGAPRGQHAIATRGAEIGAYLLSHGIGIVTLFVLYGRLGTVFASLRQSGRPELAVALGMTTSMFVTVLMFTTFVLRRRAFAGPPPMPSLARAAFADARTRKLWPEPVGIGGWLVLWAIKVVIVPITLAGAVLLEFARLVYFSRAGYGASRTGLESYLAVAVLAHLGLFAFWIYAAVLFFRKHCDAPQAAINLLLTTWACSVLLALLFALCVGATPLAATQGKMLVLGVVSAIIWINYFRVSRRVKMTFVN